MNPLTVNSVIIVDHVLRSTEERRVEHARRARGGTRAARAARSARVALERAGL